MISGRAPWPLLSFLMDNKERAALEKAILYRTLDYPLFLVLEMKWQAGKGT